MPNLRGACGAVADWILYGTLAAFFLTLVAIVAAAFVTRDAPEFPPSPVDPRPLAGSVARDTVTIEASDETRWRFFDFDRQSVVEPPDTVGWDLAVRRFNIIAGGGVLSAGVLPFGEPLRAPDTGYASNTLGRDTTNAAIARWYTYGMISHMLTPKDDVYVVRTAEGNYAKMQILGYYCPGIVAGCLTFRYVYRGDGSSTIE